MTPDCVETIKKLEQENEVFADLTIEQLLYAAIAGNSLDEVMLVLSVTNWKKWIPGESYSGQNAGQQMIGIIVKPKSGNIERREILFQDIDLAERVKMILRYL